MYELCYRKEAKQRRPYVTVPRINYVAYVRAEDKYYMCQMKEARSKIWKMR